MTFITSARRALRLRQSCSLNANAVIFAALIVCAGILLPANGDLRAQTTDEAQSSEAESQEAVVDEEVIPAEELLSEEELDELVAPVALYPDALLAQVFVASTYPLEIVKSDRWVEDNKDLAEDKRTEAAEAEGWDESVAVLAAGFPGVIERMADEIDWTEQLGDAMLVQSDDVLDAVQRQRARADAMGNLETNEAQTVTVEGDNIAITPTQPEVVYVPAYDSEKVYTTEATTPAVVTQPTEEGFSTGSLVATGLLSFGAGMLVNEIFDDDDDWHGYWGPSYGRPPVVWGGGGYVRPRPIGRGGNVGNNVNINTGTQVNIDGDGRWKPSERDRARARRDISKRKGVSGDRAGLRDGRPRAADRSRSDLKAKMNSRSGGADALSRTKTKPKLTRNSGAKNSALSSRKNSNLSRTKKEQARGAKSTAKRNTGARKAAAKPRKISKPAGGKRVQRKAGGRQAALSRKGGGSKAKRASARGKASRGKVRRR